MGGGPSSGTIKAEQAAGTGQSQIAATSQAEAAQQYAQYQALTGPAVVKYSALAGVQPPPGTPGAGTYDYSQGARGAALQAAEPVIGPLQQAYQMQQTQLLNSMPPGAARDAALQNLQLQQYTGTATALANMTNQAPDILANIGAGMGAMSLNQVSQALSGYGGAANTFQNVAQMQNAGKANTLSALSSVATVVGGALGGPIGGMVGRGIGGLFGGGGGGGGTSTTNLSGYTGGMLGMGTPSYGPGYAIATPTFAPLPEPTTDPFQSTFGAYGD